MCQSLNQKEKHLSTISASTKTTSSSEVNLNLPGGKGSSGYSISVTYDDKGKPVVKVQTYGDVDMVELRRDIQQRHPGGKIEGLEKQPLIRVVGEEEKERQKLERKGEEKKPIKKEEKEQKEPLIRIVEWWKKLKKGSRPLFNTSTRDFKISALHAFIFHLLRTAKTFQ